MTDDAGPAHEPESPPTHRPRRRAGVAPIVVASVLAAALLATLLVLWLSGEQVLGFLMGKSVDPQKVEVSADAFKSYFKVERKLAGPRGRALLLVLRRTRSFPQSDSDLEALAERTDNTFPALRVLQAVGDGYVRCEYFAKKGSFLGHTFARIKDLATSETMELSLPVGSYDGVERVVLTY